MKVILNESRLVCEGGNMFDNVVPIHQENVAATMDDIYERLIEGCLGLEPEIDTASLGSTGKKLPGGTSGDVDIALDYNKLKEKWDLPEWNSKRIPEWMDLAHEAADKCGVDFNMAATICSLAWPIANTDGKQEGEFVQLDLMPTTNLKLTRFGRFSQQEKEGETFFKGTVRNIMLSIMARCSYHKDLTDETHIKVLADGTEKEVHNEYEGWTYDGNTGLHLCHKKYGQFKVNSHGHKKGEWKPHADVIDSPVITSDPEEIVEMIFGPGVTLEDVDSVQKMWKAWKNSPAVKENPDLIDEVRRQMEGSGKDSELKWPDFDGEEFVEEASEAKPKKKSYKDMEPEERHALHVQQIDDHLSQLNDEQMEKLRDRCEELRAKWGETDNVDDPIQAVRDFMSGSGFLKMLRSVTPLKEPKMRDMGANTFVSKFFELPFDLEAYVGKAAKEKGIPYGQALSEYNQDIHARTCTGARAHNIADDAIKGKPPRFPGDNVKEIAVFSAIYDYAKQMVDGADYAESEVSLNAKDVNVGGRFDLMFHKDGVWTLVDWKVSEEDLTDIPTGKFGLDDVTKDINNNTYNKYALQLNVYEWAARNQGIIPEGDKCKRQLHQFNFDDGDNVLNIKVIEIPDMQELVKKMIERGLELGIVKHK